MRREHGRILGDVLDKLDGLADGRTPRISLAGLAARANVPHDRLMLYLDELRRHRLVDGDRLPQVTPRGLQFLECYRAWVRIQLLYGIQDNEPDAPVQAFIGMKTL